MFSPAKKEQLHLKIAIDGPSGSGKTYSALMLAKGLVENGIGKRIGVVDTESGSSTSYAKKFKFDIAKMNPPYDTIKYIQAIEFCVKEGIDVLILDSISHAWSGVGGLLDQKEKLDSIGSNKSGFANWKSISAKQEKFVATILHSPIHIIATMRSKQEYVLTTNDNGKQVPKKLGLAPVQRDGIEYEFTTVFSIDLETHQAVATKDRTGVFTAPRVIDESFGKDFADWLKDGVEPETPAIERIAEHAPTKTLPNLAPTGQAKPANFLQEMKDRHTK